MASTWWSDAIDAVSDNVLPFFTAQNAAEQQRVASQSQVAIAQAQAGASVASEKAKAQVYWAMAISGVAAVGLILLIRARR